MHTDQSPLRRGEPRSEIVNVEIHGIASRNQGREQGPFIIWDISDKGLRLWLPERVKAGEVLKLTIAKPFVVMVNVHVRWCRAVKDGTGFQVGVRALDNLARLEALHLTITKGITEPKKGTDTPRATAP